MRARASAPRALRAVELAAWFLLILLFTYPFYISLFPRPPAPRSFEYTLSHRLGLSALVLALATGFAKNRALVSSRAARWLELACWSLYFAGLIALSFSPERADPWSWHLPAWTGTAIYLILYGPARVLSVPVSAPVKQLTVEEMYGELLDAYLQAWGGPPERVKAKIEAEIRKLVERGLSREEAVKRLYRRMLLGYSEARITKL
jgi:hypothetical protein